MPLLLCVSAGAVAVPESVAALIEAEVEAKYIIVLHEGEREDTGSLVPGWRRTMSTPSRQYGSLYFAAFVLFSL